MPPAKNLSVVWVMKFDSVMPRALVKCSWKTWPRLRKFLRFHIVFVEVLLHERALEEDAAHGNGEGQLRRAEVNSSGSLLVAGLNIFDRRGRKEGNPAGAGQVLVALRPHGASAAQAQQHQQGRQAAAYKQG